MFWSYQLRFPFWGIHRGPWYGPWMQCLMVYKYQTSSLTISTFFWFCFHILLAFYWYFDIQHSLTFHIWKYTMDPGNTTQHHHQPFPFFSDFFYIFLLFFYLAQSYLPYMEICNGPWKYHLTSSPTIPIFFWIFPYILLFFYLAQPYFPYLEMCTGPWKQHTQCRHQQWAPSPIFCPDFFPILLLFFIWKSAHFLIWKCTLDPENSAWCHHQQWGQGGMK